MPPKIYDDIPGGEAKLSTCRTSYNAWVPEPVHNGLQKLYTKHDFKYGWLLNTEIELHVCVSQYIFVAILF